MQKSRSFKARIGHTALMMSIATVVTLPLGLPTAADASPIYAFQQSIAIPGAATFSGYDLATFDGSNQLYYLTDRTNNAVDVFSAASNSYVGRIGQGLFAGSQGGKNDIAGPNGISLSNVGVGKLLVAGNGPSNFISFNLDSTGLNVIGAPRTTSTAVAGTPTPPNRVDGMAFAPTANTVLAANNASNPGFLTLVDNATGAVKRSILLNGTGGYPDVGANGVEATIFNTARKSFFVAVPSLNAAGKGAGGVIELDATTGNLLHVYDFNAMGLGGACSPTGLVQGAGASMFVVCSDATAGHSVVLDPTGAGSLKTVAGISGGDQAAYDPGTNTFFEAARFQPGGPVLGIIDASTFSLQTLAIGANDHSVAVDPISGKVFIATGPTTAFDNCGGGCIGVIAPTKVPEPGTLALMIGGLAMATGFGLRRHSVRTKG